MSLNGYIQNENYSFSGFIIYHRIMCHIYIRVILYISTFTYIQLQYFKIQVFNLAFGYLDYLDDLDDVLYIIVYI